MIDEAVAEAAAAEWSVARSRANAEVTTALAVTATASSV
jgi:hypothetical protein